MTYSEDVQTGIYNTPGSSNNFIPTITTSPSKGPAGILEADVNKESRFSQAEFASIPLSVRISTPGTTETIDSEQSLQGVHTSDDDDLPSTQLIDNRVLKNVTAYVEVRSTNDNRSEAICKELEILGAVVTKKFTDDVTHVVFKEGSKRTKNKATKNKIHLVSVLWVDSCKQYQEHVSEKLYPAIVPTTNKGTPLFMAKLKKAKSMQPSNFDEEVANSAERFNKKKRKLVDRLQSSESTPQNSPNLGRILVQETQPRTPVDMKTPIRLLIPDTPPSMREKMKQLKSKDSCSSTPVIENEEEEPLQRRLFTGVTGASFDAIDVDHLMGGLKDEINKCIENMPESPLPSSVGIRSVSSPACDISSPCTESIDNVAVVKRSNPSPEGKKRRKSIAAVKFVDNESKQKRTSNRRKSVATFTPSKIMEAEESDTKLYSLIQVDRKRNGSKVESTSSKKLKSTKERRKSSLADKRLIERSTGDVRDVDDNKVNDRCSQASTVKVSTEFKNTRLVDSVTSTVDMGSTNVKTGPKSSKKKLLPLSDMDPALPLLSKTPERQVSTKGQKRKQDQTRGNESNISALFPNKSPTLKRSRKNSHIETVQKSNHHESQITSISTSTDTTMTDDPTLQETTINSSTTIQKDSSMSAVFGDSILNSLSGKVPPRPSIDEFNLRKGIKQIRRHKAVSTSSHRQSDSDSSDNCASKKTYRRSPPSRPSLVMTSLHAEEQDVVISVVKKLGHFVISDNVTDSTTHLICGGPRRTLNVLYGIMKGIWILHKQWVLSSLEALTWLPEENYEVTDYFPVVKVTREGRYLHKENYQSLSLSDFGSIFVAQKTSPPRHHLLNLLRICGAKVINNPNKADIYMGHEFLPDKTCVNPVWVLDCIAQQQALDVDRYLLGRPKRDSSPEF